MTALPGAISSLIRRLYRAVDVLVRDAGAMEREALKLIRPEHSLRLHLLLRRHSVVTIPGPWARILVSFAHGEAEMEKVAEAYRLAAQALADEISGSE